MDAKEEIENLKEAIAILTDGKVDRNDIAAAIQLVGSLAGLAALAWMAIEKAIG